MDRLAGANVEIVCPTSYAERIDVREALAAGEASHRIAAACLGLCWPRLRRRIPYRGRVAEYGGQVLDLLLSDGATPEEVWPHAARALEVVAQAEIPTRAGVEAAAGNSEAPTGG